MPEEEEKKSSKQEEKRLALARIFEEITNERRWQEQKYGTEHDDLNTLNDWAVQIMTKLCKSTERSANVQQQRKAMSKVASLAVAALEAFDRNGRFAKRHYDRK